ncbi:MAG: PQQ-binding-like beta-propeller repeat protein [Phycisphaeraceae bacterium]
MKNLLTLSVRCALALAAAFLILLQPAFAGDWPEFQGPNRDGVVPNAEILTDWPDAGPTVVWTQDVAPGFGGAAVVGDTVYLLDRNGIKGDRFRAINLHTGKKNWAIDYDAPGRLSYDGARSTPTLGDGPAGPRAYTVGPLGHITCFDVVKGEILWQKHMDDFHAAPPKWGWSQSPLLVGNLIIVQPMTDDAGLVALNQGTGEVAWQSKSIGREGYASPRQVRLAGTDMLITFTSTQVTGLNPKTGDILWAYDNIPVKRAIPTPAVVGDNKLFITAGYDSGSALIEIQKQGVVFGVKEIKRDLAHGGQIHSALPVGEHLYVNLNTNENLRQRGKDAQGLGCFDTNGELLWISNNQPDINRGPILALGQHLLTLGGEDGTLRLIKADAKGYQELASFKAFPADQKRNMIWAPMAYADGRLLIRSQSQLKCLDFRPKPLSRLP